MSISPLSSYTKPQYVVTVKFECSGTDLASLASAPISVAVRAFRQMFGHNAPLFTLQEIRCYFKEGQ